MSDQIDSQVIDSLFEGASGDRWIGNPTFTESIPEYLQGDYLPAIFGKTKVLFSFHQYFVYGGDLDIYSYTNMLLQRADGSTFAPAIDHRFLGVTIVDDEKFELIGQTVKCAAKSLLGVDDNTDFSSVAGEAVLRFYQNNPQIKQYFFFGDDMAKAVLQIQAGLEKDSNAKYVLTMLNGLVAPCYGFELSEKRS